MTLQEQLKNQGDYLFKYRGYLPIIFLVFALVIKAYYIENSPSNSPTVAMFTDFMNSVSIYVGLFGLIVRIYTVGYTPKNTSGRNTKEGQVANELNTKGLYSTTRNPLYLGNFFMWMGVILYINVAWLFILFTFVFWIYYERIIYAEEFFLKQKFGNDYLKWAEMTPVFMPKKLCYVHPKQSFNWEKILIKEKSGFLMYFLILFIIQQFSNFIETNSFNVDFNFITNGLIASCALYISVKLIQVLQIKSSD
ncbi:MAG: isoprenylcysteine carboxylmethyltransferase family protein [Flavobacteriaceae bacterium]|nr:isoprenylcysteine carboxylmethyltransferase family protein [Flavobacteriaceae bacterium]